MNTKTPIILVILLATSACSNTGSSSTPAAGNNQDVATEEQTSLGSFVPFSRLATVELLTPSSGAGSKPKFEWSSVDGAAQYSLFLQFSDGQPYWSWTGSSTSIYLGGLDSAPPEDAAGPILLEGMSWAVIALDADGNVIASSNLQTISP